MEESRRLARALHVDQTTFVYPRNEEAYRDLLPSLGFSAYTVEQKQPISLNDPLDTPVWEKGLLRVPRHLYLARWRTADQMKVGARMLVAKRYGFCHLWFHDWNLESEATLNATRRLLIWARRLGYTFCTVSDLVRLLPEQKPP